MPDTILSAGNFLLLQTDLLSQIKQASVGVPCLPGITLVPREGLLWWKDKVFVPDNVRVAMLRLCHDHAVAGHFGVHQTFDLVWRTFWWPDSEKNCKEYVNARLLEVEPGVCSNPCQFLIDHGECCLWIL